jgi:small subunit ribosomal protein S16
MATKIRLQRHGRKGSPFYKVVVADSRAPRDGKFIERIGSYNPNTNPATIDLNFERALYWLSVGAQPTDTVRCILSREGVLYKNHLNGGVRKGAFDQATADSRFEAWLKGKKDQLNKVAEQGQEVARAEARKRMAQEEEQNQARAREIAEKKAAMEKEKAEAEAAARAAEEAENAQEVAEEAEAPVAEEA